MPCRQYSAVRSEMAKTLVALPGKIDDLRANRWVYVVAATSGAASSIQLSLGLGA